MQNDVTGCLTATRLWEHKPLPIYLYSTYPPPVSPHANGLVPLSQFILLSYVFSSRVTPPCRVASVPSTVISFASKFSSGVGCCSRSIGRPGLLRLCNLDNFNCHPWCPSISFTSWRAVRCGTRIDSTRSYIVSVDNWYFAVGNIWQSFSFSFLSPSFLLHLSSSLADS